MIDAPLTPVRVAPEFQAFLDDLEVLGLKPSCYAGERYGIVGARSNARWWLIPLGNRRATAMGLNLFQPISVSARIAKFLGKVSARIGVIRPLFRRDIFLTGSTNFGALFADEVLSLAFFTGTAGPHRKTAVQIMNGRGNVLGYAKISQASAVRPFLRNESHALCLVRNMDLHSADVPNVLLFRDDDKLTMLVTDGLKTSKANSPNRLTTKHIEFLCELRCKTGQLGASFLLNELTRDTASLTILEGGWSDRIARALQALTLKSNAIELCFAHGDFTPWNCYIQDERLYVFDWEYSRSSLPTGYDMVHYILATSNRNALALVSSRVLTALSQVYFGGNTRTARDAFLLSLICHAVFYLKRLILTNMPLTAWEDQEVRGMLIDKLIDS